MDNTHLRILVSILLGIIIVMFLGHLLTDISGNIRIPAPCTNQCCIQEGAI